MSRLRHPAITALAVLAFAGCAQEDEGQRVELAASAANVVMMMPITTASDDALNHFMQGQRALDMGRPDDARPHFEQAISADANFALGYLSLANSSNSLGEFKKHLQLAGEHAAAASDVERLMIEFAQKGFENDMTGQMHIAQRLVELQPSSPRAWTTRAQVQSAMSNETEARASLRKAIEVGPTFAPAYATLGNSYLFIEPRDPVEAQKLMQKLVELEPDEAQSHDLLGDAYRAQGQLEKAAEAYTKTAELDPSSGSGFQQRAHVNSFLGNFAQARADYDAAIERAENGNVKVSFAVYRTLVNVHEGNAQAAVDELDQLVARIDGMGIPEPTGLKIFALSSLIEIALHHGIFPPAEQAIAHRNELLARQAEQAGTEDARRQAEATAALASGELAARRGDYETATQKAAEFMKIMEPSTDPGRNEPAHALLGLVSLKQGNHDEAVAHYQQADPNSPYVTYHRALALEGAGKTTEALELFQQVANNNFNSPGLALVRKDAMAKSGSQMTPKT